MNITIILNTEEQAALHQLIDAALRQAGAGALDVAVHFKTKIAQAVAAAQEVKEPFTVINGG